MSAVVYQMGRIRGSHKGTKPQMADTHISVMGEARQQAFNGLCKRPNAAYVEYNNLTATLKEHGKYYIYNGEEEFAFSDESSHTEGGSLGGSGKWVGTVTVAYKIGFDVSDA